MAIRSAEAGGLFIYEMGTPDLGTASAGRAALARDASTVFGNPAGMIELDRSQLLVGIQPGYGNVQFDKNSKTTTSGNSGHNASGPFLSGSAYYAHKFNDDLAAGIWSGSYFGGRLDYGDDWAGRYYGTEVELLTLGAGINGAYRVTDWLSIGGGAFVLYGKLAEKVAVRDVLDPSAEGELKIDTDEPGFGGMAGFLLKPRPGTRIGVTYISPVKLDFEDVGSFHNIGPGLRAALDRSGLSGRKVDFGLTIPQQVMVSGYQQLTERVAIMANIVWQDWSAFGKPSLSVSGTDVDDETLDLDYNDTWGVALGLEYAFLPDWLWSVGAALDTSPLTKHERTPILPLDQQYRIGTGLQHQFTPKITGGIAYEYLYSGEAEMDVDRGPLAGRLAGDYSSNDAHFVSLTLQWKF